MRLRHFLGAVAAGVWSKDRRPLIDQFREIFCQEPSCDDPYLNSLCREIGAAAGESGGGDSELLNGSCPVHGYDIAHRNSVNSR